MHELEVAILEAFKRRPTAHLTTGELVDIVFPEVGEELSYLLKSPNRQEQRRGKQRKARLHRKLLYHLNKLVEERIIAVAGTLGKGEKTFSLALREGEVEIKAGKKSILIHKPSKIRTPIDNMPGVVAFRREEWLHKVNAIVLEGSRHETLGDAAEAIVRTLHYVNDAVGLHRVESAIGHASVDQIEEFFTRLERSAADYGRRVTLILSTTMMRDEARAVRFIRHYCSFAPKHVSLVLNVTPKELHERREFFMTIIPFFIKDEVKFHLKNSSIHPAPIIYGEAGAYSLTVDEWRAYKAVRGKGNGFCIGGATVVIDLAEAPGRLHALARKAAESLFLAGVERRRGFEQAMSELRAQGITFVFTNEYLRLWNYDPRDEIFLQEVDAAETVLREFSKTQERVYRACGMPIRFRTVLSSTFGKDITMSPRRYRKVSVTGLASLQKKQLVETLRIRERLIKRFVADRVRFFRSGKFDAEEVLREVTSLISSYGIPVVTYDYAELRGDLKLTEFFNRGAAPEDEPNERGGVDD